MKLSLGRSDKQKKAPSRSGASGGEGRESSRRRSVRYKGLTLVRFNLLTVLFVTLIIAASGFVTLYKFEQQAAGQAGAIAAKEADGVAAHLSGRLEALTAMVDAVAGDPQLVQAAATGMVADNPEVERRLDALSSLFPGVVRLRLNPVGIADPVTTVTPAISYACLDQIQQVEKGQRVSAEVHKFKTDEQHIDLVSPVMNGGRVAATLLVTLDVNQLKPWLRSAVGAGYAELKQNIGGTFVIASHGNAALKGGGAPFTVAVAQSRWSIDYWPAQVAGGGGSNTQVLLILFLFAIVLAVIVILVFAAIADGIFKKDMVRFMSLILDLVKGNSPRPIEVKLLDVRESIAALEQVHRLQKSAVKENKDKAAAKQPGGFDVSLDDDDDMPPPDPMFIASAGVTVEEENGDGSDADGGAGRAVFELPEEPAAATDEKGESESDSGEPPAESGESPVAEPETGAEPEPEPDPEPEPVKEVEPLEFESFDFNKDEKDK